VDTKRIGTLLIVAICVIILFPAGSWAETVILFPDEALERAVRSTLRYWHNPLTTEKLAKLTTLEAQQAGITNVSGLEFAVNLKKLDLTDNQISDLSPLRGLENLEYLNLKWNHVTNITALKGLTNLTYLGLENNQISDISPLSSLRNLTRLNLGVNRVNRLDTLGRLTSLEQLILYYNDISNIGPLAGLIRLQVLNLSDNQISDISPLIKNVQAGGLTGGFVNLTHNRLNTSEGSRAMADIQKLLDGDVVVNYGSQEGRRSVPPQPAIETRIPRGVATAQPETVTGVEVVPDLPLAGPEPGENIFVQLQTVITLLMILLVLYTLKTVVFVKHDKSFH
jgi:Leucine-rich repeat (LRR) protein